MAVLVVFVQLMKLVCVCVDALLLTPMSGWMLEHWVKLNEIEGVRST